MSLLVYKVLHIAGALCVLFGLGGLSALSLTAPASPAEGAAEGEASEPSKPPGRALFSALHGLGLLLLLVAGFGALAKLGIKAPPGWVWVKLMLWLALGAAPVVLKRAKLPTPALIGIPLLAALAGAFALLKPGG